MSRTTTLVTCPSCGEQDRNSFCISTPFKKNGIIMETYKCYTCGKEWSESEILEEEDE